MGIRGLFVPTIAAIVTAAFMAVAFLGSYAFFKSQELQKAEARLTLYRGTVEAALDHFSHLPFLLSLDPIVIDALTGGDRAALDKRLARIAQSAGIDAIFVMDVDGITISASNARTPNSFVGQNYGYRPYFQAALDGEMGEFYGIGATTGIPGYFYAMPVRPVGEGTRGVIAIKLDLSELQESWRATGERIILSNADGVILLASEPSWRYRTLLPLSADDRNRIAATRQFADEALSPLDWSNNVPSQTATIAGERFLYVRTSNLPNSWALHFLASDNLAATRAWLTTGVLALLTGVFFLAWQLRRVRRMGLALARSEREEAQLRMANERLAIEIEERRAAERTLKKTQAELERAGRLAALGQLASSVTHELGQPIAAMRNQLAANEMSSGTSRLGIKMQELVARMEDITRQLKFFSRKGRDQFECVDLTQVISGALEMLTPNIAEVRARVTFDPSDEDLTVFGNRLRLEQVVTNLVRNALDAVENLDRREIEISIGRDGDNVWFEIADTGHGLGEKSIDDLREPFATTKESGKGMGLGLTISAGIASDHGGALTAKNRKTGGAIFRAVFPHFRSVETS